MHCRKTRFDAVVDPPENELSGEPFEADGEALVRVSSLHRNPLFFSLPMNNGITLHAGQVPLVISSWMKHCC